MFGILIILVIGSLNLFFSLEIIIVINTSPYPFIKALLFPTQIYSPGAVFLYRLKRLLWFTIFTFKPKSRIIDLFKGYVFFWLMCRETVEQFPIHRINY